MQTLFLGNELAKTFLQQVTEHDRLGHAYLIYGEKGLGKKTFARLFAQSVLCTGERKPCSACSACRKMMSGNHPDFQLVEGTEAKGSIHIDTIRTIRSDCVIKPNEGTRKIYCITNIQNMTAGAFNAFLKTLEEPPDHVLFLLTAPNLESVPETIVSRLTLIPLYPLSDSQMEEGLMHRFPDLDRKEMMGLISRCGGNLGAAIRCLQEPDVLALSKTVGSLIDAIARKQEYEMLRILTSCEKDRERFLCLLNELILELRRAMRYKVSGQAGEGVSLAQNLTAVQQMQLIEFLEQSKQQLSNNANVGLMVIYVCCGIKERIE
jgi:DNA polymerase-3 subunit delta'